MLHWAHTSPNPKRHLNRFGRFCTGHRRLSLYFTKGRPFSPSKLPTPVEIWTPSNTSFGRRKSSTQTAPESLQPFCRAHYGDRQTHRQTDRQTSASTSTLLVLRCGLKRFIKAACNLVKLLTTDIYQQLLLNRREK